jgi:dTDP-glucose pyrophosphorylase
MINYPELKNFFITEVSTIENAIKVIDNNGKGICLVIDSKNNLKGLLTDGDIRRLLLKGSYLFDKISKNYNKNFFYIKKDYIHKINQEEIKKKFSHIPILKKRKIISLLLKDDLQIEKRSNFIFILAGGLGKRMGNLTKNLPKPMLKINKKPILENQINLFKSKGFYNFIISVNYLSNKIINYFGDGKKFGINIEYFKENFFLGTAGPLSLLKNKKILSNVIIINGDIYADLDFRKILNYHEKNNNDLTLCATRQQYKFPFGVINQNTKTLDFINEKPELNFLVNSGIYIIKPKILKLLKFNKYLDMNNFINFLKKNKKKIGIYLIYERFFDIGNKSQYNKVKDIFNN